MGLFSFLTQGGRRVDSIEQAIQAQEYDKANEILDLFEQEINDNVYDAIKDTRVSQASALRDRLTKEEGISYIRKSVADYDLALAQEKLKELNDQKLLSKQEITDLGKLVYSITEQGFLSGLKSCTLVERREWSEKFAELYSGSKERTKVVEDLIVEEFSNLFNSVKGTIFYDDLYALLHNLNRTLEKYSSEGISLGGIVPIEDVVKQVRDYVGEMKVKKIIEEGQITKGSYVMVNGKVSSSGWLENYISQRKKIVPQGFVGIAERFIPSGNSRESVIVHFENANFVWDSTWDKTYISLDCAQFFFEELTKIDTVNQIDKNHLTKTLERTEELFRKNYSNTNTSGRVSNINELESQDFRR